MARFLQFVNKTKIAASDSSAPTGHGKKRGEVGAFIPGTAGDSTSIVEVSVSCKHLPNKDLLSKSDPMLVIFHRPPGSRKWTALMRTEIIQDDLDPEFVQKLLIEWRFEQVQQLRFEVYDVDSKNAGLENHDLIGFLDCTLGQIVNNREEGLTLELNTMKCAPLANNQEPATITLVAEEVGSERDEVLLKMCGVNCGTWKFIIPPRTYFLVYKHNDIGRHTLVYRSESRFGSNPSWPPMRISCRTLCNGDADRELRIDIYQQHINVGRSLVGSYLTTLNKLLKHGQEKIQLMSPTGTESKSSIRILACEVAPICTFIDYLQAGTQIHTVFAIDFTCSNGDPADSQSLHYKSPGSQIPNPYEQAIRAVGTILQDYDSASLFPAYGFGARIPPKGELSYDFPLTLNRNSPNCNSIPGVLEHYRKCVDECQLYGPTYFANLIKLVSDQARRSRNGENYYILVIITDGVITDVAKTKKAIVDASTLPMSIIIIGVGEADFDAMEELDGDAVRLKYKRKAAARDIVQFVAYRSARTWLSNTGECTTEGLTNGMDDYLNTNISSVAKVGNLSGEGAVEGVEGEEGGEDADADAKSRRSAVSTVEVKPVTPTADVVPPAIAGGDDGELPEESEDKTNRLAAGQLAAEILAEIPEQIVGYMKLKGILPQHIREGQKNAAKANYEKQTKQTLEGVVGEESEDQKQG